MHDGFGCDGIDGCFVKTRRIEMPTFWLVIYKPLPQASALADARYCCKIVSA